MCYSAQVIADWRQYAREHEATLTLHDFWSLYSQRLSDPSIRIPKAIDAAFTREAPSSDLDAQLQCAIAQWKAQQIGTLEPEMFVQRKRLADAQRKLQLKPSKSATESARIAANKVEQARRRLGNLNRVELQPGDARIYPGWYALVMVQEGGRRVIKPMRYLCRIEGVPAQYDRRFPGTYNARRDNLDRFWRRHWGHKHGVLLATAFYENVSRHALEQRVLGDGEVPENVVLEFKPQGMRSMLVACLWSDWRAGADRLLSFAAITDEPPAEVAAAGHDRCIIALRAEHLDAWLNPDPHNLARQAGILDDRERPYYQHRITLAA
jgi:putative SOS response-associated peptidase YedK